MSPALPRHCLSLLHSHSQLEPLSAASEAFQARFLFCTPFSPSMDIIFHNECAGNPLALTSTGKLQHFQPASAHSKSRSWYFAYFRLYASSTLSSHGMVSSTMMTCLLLLDQITISGLNSVLLISRGKCSCLSRSTSISQSPADANNPCSRCFSALVASLDGLTYCIKVCHLWSLLSSFLPPSIVQAPSRLGHDAICSGPGSTLSYNLIGCAPKKLSFHTVHRLHPLSFPTTASSRVLVVDHTQKTSRTSKSMVMLSKCPSRSRYALSLPSSSSKLLGASFQLPSVSCSLPTTAELSSGSSLGPLWFLPCSTTEWSGTRSLVCLCTRFLRSPLAAVLSLLSG